MTNANYDALVAAVAASQVDADKFYGEKANAQAGKRLRAHAKTISDLAKQIRKDVSEIKASRKTA
jgi:hypothetical protein